MRLAVESSPAESSPPSLADIVFSTRPFSGPGIFPLPPPPQEARAQSLKADVVTELSCTQLLPALRVACRMASLSLQTVDQLQPAHGRAARCVACWGTNRAWPSRAEMAAAMAGCLLLYFRSPAAAAAAAELVPGARVLDLDSPLDYGWAYAVPRVPVPRGSDPDAIGRMMGPAMRFLNCFGSALTLNQLLSSVTEHVV